MTRSTFESAFQVLKGQEIEGIGTISWLNHGFFSFKGVNDPLAISEVGEVDLAPLKPPQDSEKAFRYLSGQEESQPRFEHTSPEQSTVSKQSGIRRLYVFGVAVFLGLVAILLAICFRPVNPYQQMQAFRLKAEATTELLNWQDELPVVLKQWRESALKLENAELRKSLLASFDLMEEKSKILARQAVLDNLKKLSVDLSEAETRNKSGKN